MVDWIRRSSNQYGIEITVRVTPRAARNALGGTILLADGRTALSARITAPPAEGAANRALVELVATALGLRKTDVAIISGTSARLKRLRLSGDVVVLEAMLVGMA